MDRNLQILGLAKKAGLLAIGAEDAKAAVLARKAAVILSGLDASEGARSRARKNAESCGVPYTTVPYSCFELGGVTGRGSPGTLAILDTGLAARFMRGLAETEPERYGAVAEFLEQKVQARADKKRQTPRRMML